MHNNIKRKWASAPVKSFSRLLIHGILILLNQSFYIRYINTAL